MQALIINLNIYLLRNTFYYVPSPSLTDCAAVLVSSVCPTQVRVLLITFIYLSLLPEIILFKTIKCLAGIRVTPLSLSYFSYPYYCRMGLREVCIFLSHTMLLVKCIQVCFLHRSIWLIALFFQIFTSSLYRIIPLCPNNVKFGLITCIHQ